MSSYARDNAPTGNSAVANRWVIAVAGFFLQIALGAVYGWSNFLSPVMKHFNVSKPEANLTFTLALVALGITAVFGGYLNSRFGPRTIGTIGGILYGLGVFLAGFAPSLVILYLTYGILGGIGLGLGYIVPLAVLIKWFPDKRGFITGLAVAGFGLGAFVTSPIATALIGSVGLMDTFKYLGIAYLIVVVVASQFLKVAPANYAPAGWTPSSQQKTNRAARDYTLGEALSSPRWYILWLILALNVTAGAALISVASPLAQDFAGVSAGTAALLVSAISVFNGVGRLFWGWLSDAIGRPYTFLAIYVIQIFAFLLLSQISNFALIFLPAALIGLCYGGGFGTMPAFAADFFGPKNAGTIYGAMLTAWSAGAIVGPILISSLAYRDALLILAGIMLVSCILPFVARMLNRTETPPTEGVPS
ncbi:MAG TPA: OFA family MFS transporter [Chloroflexia bacterium]|nr:OFA family MFS transporter [Chloroflexia bacterium]